MAIEAALVKPVVDALMALFRRGENMHLKHDAEAALREAIRELLLANPDENKAQAKIAIAKAAGILSEGRGAGRGHAAEDPCGQGENRGQGEHRAQAQTRDRGRRGEAGETREENPRRDQESSGQAFLSARA